MICLDTNYLIRAFIRDSSESKMIQKWIINGDPIILPSIAWYEFMSGALSDEEVKMAKALITHGIRSFQDEEAQRASFLFCSLKRPRRLKIDAMIAGTAIVANAKLATNNREDFEPFIRYGLKMV